MYCRKAAYYLESISSAVSLYLGPTLRRDQVAVEVRVTVKVSVARPAILEVVVLEVNMLGVIVLEVILGLIELITPADELMVAFEYTIVVILLIAGVVTLKPLCALEPPATGITCTGPRSTLA